MKDLLKLSVACLLASAFNANAAEKPKSETSESKMKIEEVKAAPALTAEEDPDQIITNAKLRAESGSKSKWSISTAIQYRGSTLEKPFDNKRPNITNGTQNSDLPALAGTVAVKRNLSARNSLSAGAGVRWLTPFEGSAPKKKNGESYNKMDADNPYVTFQRLGKVGGFQSVTQFTPTLVTNDLRQYGHLMYVNLQQIFAYEIGKLTLAGLFSVGTGVYDKEDAASKSAQSDYNFGIYPYVEYQLSDKLHLRTISGVYVYEHVRSETSAMTFQKNTIYQSVGLGIALTRDIYLYPNIQFIPEDIRADRTNVALNTNINLF